MWENHEKSGFPRDQGDDLSLLVFFFSDQQSKTKSYSVNRHIKQRKAKEPAMNLTLDKWLKGSLIFIVARNQFSNKSLC